MILVADLPKLHEKPSDRYHIYTVDGRTGQVVSEVSVIGRYLDEKRADIVQKAYERAGQEMLLKLGFTYDSKTTKA